MSVSRSVEWGVLTGMRKVETVEQMPEDYRQVVLKLLAALAAAEFASFEQHHPWINQGPTPEDRYIQAQIAADEAHQGFIDCRLLKQFGPDGAAMADDLLTKKMGDHMIDAFNVPFESWVDTVAAASALVVAARAAKTVTSAARAAMTAMFLFFIPLPRWCSSAKGGPFPRTDRRSAASVVNAPTAARARAWGRARAGRRASGTGARRRARSAP
jgi:hypothetical protein